MSVNARDWLLAAGSQTIGLVVFGGLRGGLLGLGIALVVVAMEGRRS